MKTFHFFISLKELSGLRANSSSRSCPAPSSFKQDLCDGRQKTFLVSRGHIQHLMKEQFLSKLLERHPDSCCKLILFGSISIKFLADLGCSHKSASVFTGDECRRFTSPSPFSLRVPPTPRLSPSSTFSSICRQVLASASLKRGFNHLKNNSMGALGSHHEA